MPTPDPIEVFVAMNEDGDHVVATDGDDALELLRKTHCGRHARVVRLVLAMTPPALTSLSLAIPDEGSRSITVAATEHTP